ncbi:flagellar assembly protein FliW [uncultured Desulfobulbus sp.]|uniref:flagellar assembly protein FliW n=1 Tax=uncultured Desulfobulbus sp. TaxID=239745 RepID=UPI0029C67B42|nr:flagellar assembly protein FliW [uncultured Desulfobulbus sp.]
MKKLTSRFGEIEYDPQNSIHFPDGLIGFETLHDFIVIPNRKEGPLFWIQSIDDPEVAFIVTDPSNFFLEYKVLPDKNEIGKLDIQSPEDCYALSIVTVSSAKEITLNLVAPVLFSPTSNRAVQVILEDTNYEVKTPLPNS